MEFVFNTPLASVELEQPLGRSLSGGEAGNSVDCFAGVLVFAEMSDVAADAEDLLYMRKFQIIIELLARPY